ncbi:MAG: hypothetical protein ACRDAL_03305, partial [Plesiomonas shigelloides]
RLTERNAEDSPHQCSRYGMSRVIEAGKVNVDINGAERKVARKKGIHADALFVYAFVKRNRSLN